MFNWNDLRFFLMVARTGSTMAASRQLRVSQATVSRRLTELEAQLGVQLFTHQASGYSLTARGEALLPLAEAVELEVDRFGHAVGAEMRRISGRVRLTTVESAANSWVIPALRVLSERYPDIEVEVIATDANLDLARGEADIAIRFGPMPDQESLIVRHLVALEETFYAKRELVAKLGLPVDHAGIARYPIITDSIDRTGRFSRWIEVNVPDGRIVHRVNSLSGLVAGVRAGIGAALLPSIMGDDLRDLVRLMPPIEELSTPCWMVTTRAARSQPHIRAVIDQVVEQVQIVVARVSQAGEDAALSA